MKSIISGSDSLLSAQLNPSSMEMIRLKSMSTSSAGQASSPSTRILIPNIIPAMQMKYPASFHHGSPSISCSTTRALKEFERMLEPWKIVTIKSASYFRMPFAMYGTLVTAKKIAPAKISHKIQWCHALHSWFFRQSPANTAATLVHHMFPANEPAVTPSEKPRITDPRGERALKKTFNRNHSAKRIP